jgi:hypothetical protein
VLPPFVVYARIMEILQMSDEPTQLDKFKEAARDLETDDDEARFDERLRKIVKHKPVPEKPG